MKTEEELVYVQMNLEHKLINHNVFENKNKSQFESYAKFMVYKTSDSIHKFYRSDLSKNTILELESLSFDELKIYDKIHSKLRTISAWHGFSYVFDNLPSKHIHNVILENDYFVIKNGTHVVSKAFSAWEDNNAAEPIIETDESFRRNGYATSVILAWAEHQLKNKKIPFYSHLLDNQPSEKLVNKLGLRKFCEAISYGYEY